MKYILLLGRVLFSSVFFIKGLENFFPNMIDFATTMDVPMPAILVPVAGIVAFIGALSILLGFKARWGAWLLIIFLLPITLIMHRFWEFNDSYNTMMHQYCFWKNISLIGAAFMITYFGSGPLSLSKEK
jgi:putative oxidoreductase